MAEREQPPEPKAPAEKRPTLRQRLAAEGPQTAPFGTAGWTASDHVGCVDAQVFSEIVHSGLREWPERCKNGHPVKVWPGWTK